MNYKFSSLYNKIYRSFIRGEYEEPKIPTKSEVIRKMEEITSTEYTPILDNKEMSGISIQDIQNKFSSTLDDIDVLFDSIEAESRDVLDQLTNSLREHRGTKRELRRIQQRTRDINNGKLGEDYLKYDFTESFNDLSNIDSFRSDPINSDAGIFTITRGVDRILALSHYYGSKIEWSIIENYAQIEDNSFIGSSDVATMLDQSDPRQLVYRIKTSRPTRLRTSTSFQLAPDGRPMEINGVTVDVDSSVSKGYLRLFYRDGSKWLDVKTNSVQRIKEDKVVYNFPNTMATHIKLEFIKDVPDIPGSNYYYYIINNLAIFSGTSKKKSILYSKPISFDSYDNEDPIISRIQVSGDMIVPNSCDVKLYVAQDRLISGQFLDSGGEYVYPESANAVSFDPSASGTVYLSDIWNSESTVSGIEVYRSLDFDWKQLKTFGNTGEKLPEIVEFNNTRMKSRLDNSLFSITSQYTFGDRDYSGVYDISGWVNTDNSSWTLMEPLVNSGLLVSGVTIISGYAGGDYSGEAVTWVQDTSGNLNPIVYTHPEFSGQWIGFGSGAGYPFNYTIPSLGRVFRFGEYDSSVNGWWRPLSVYVTPSGIDSSVTSAENELDSSYPEYLPDFHFNGLDFYKIYKFASNQNVIEPSIKLYSYQERPVIGESGYYPSTFTWKYKSRWIDEIGIKENVSMSNPPATFKDYVIPVSSTTLRPNEEYIIDSIEEVRIHGTSVTLDKSEYYTEPVSQSQITGINLSGLSQTTNYPTTGISFDFKYRYRVKNEYLSTWTGYAIVSPGASSPTITISNQNVSKRGGTPLIKNISITNLDTRTTNVATDEGGIFNLSLSRLDSTKEAHFKITIYCISDEDTGFCANGWIPYESSYSKTITVSPGIKLVSRIKPISIVDLSTLIYDTPIDNDSRVALFTDKNDNKFLVVKEPSKGIFPGYYFNSLSKKYIEDQSSKIENIGHWIRRGVYVTYQDLPGYSGKIPVYSDEITYTTGSSEDGIVYSYDRSSVDNTWNQGATLPEYPNSTGVSFYTHHSTFGYPINVDRDDTVTLYLTNDQIDPRAPYTTGKVGSSSWLSWIQTNYPSDYTFYNTNGYVQNDSTHNRGFLFYDTAENLCSFYSITYRTVVGSSDLNKRFLYRLELLSDNDENLTPIVRSLRFTINDRI